jgi:transcriptional regulator with XRE-family HTH domain
MIGKAFKRIREAKRYSQSELARVFGVDVMTVSRWERGVVPIPRLAELALSALKPQKHRRD